MPEERQTTRMVREKEGVLSAVDFRGGAGKAFAWQMKIEIQISSKYLTYLINNCVKIESGDNKDLQTFCICIHCQCSLT